MRSKGHLLKPRRLSNWCLLFPAYLNAYLNVIGTPYAILILIKINLKIVDDQTTPKKGEIDMNNIFYIIGVIVVVLFILGYFGFR